MKIQFYGVRGSYPVPGKETTRFGGNTTCVTFTKEVQGQIARIIFDCGTGAIQLGKDILKNYFAGKESLYLNMFFTHLHPDHTQAFPFFAPNYFPDCRLELLGMRTLKKHIGKILEQEMLPPTFPIEYKDLKSLRIHHEIRDGAIVYVSSELSDKGTLCLLVDTEKQENSIFKVEAMQAFAPSHPQQGAVYYRVTDLDNGRSAACIWDIESHYGGDRRVIKFAKNVDIMIHDTQYTEEEYQADDIIVQGFGHSTYHMAVENAKQANAGKLICTHFNPAHNDAKLDKIQIQMAQDSYPVVLAKEGLEVEV
ncbi:MAG: MBL fold metallo-hydrolase [Spirochaetia bacterium]